MAGPLDGVLVVALEHAVSAPYASCRLADAGARVIKIERPEGDFARRYDSIVQGESAYFVWLNRGKESLVLDLKVPADALLLHALLARADVFLQNLGPGAAARLGFDSTTLRRQHPRLITCDISGYGDTGPYQDMKAYDLLVQVESGLASVTGVPEAPGRVGVSICDLAAGINAYAGILEALVGRARTGAGAGLAVSMFDCIADWMTVPFLYQEHTGRAPERVGLHHPSIAPYGAYPLAGGESIVLAVQNAGEWRRFCATVLGDGVLATDPRFADNESRVRHRAQLDARIHAVFARLGRDELVERLRAAGIGYGAVNTVADFCRHPQLRRVAVATPEGAVDLVAPPLRHAGSAPAPGAVPALGQHSARLRAEFAAPAG
jgi:crotonobetainyl-CoA:carnitine CoA-transferase CaiB-like acyl-CoA transferase